MPTRAVMERTRFMELDNATEPGKESLTPARAKRPESGLPRRPSAAENRPDFRIIPDRRSKVLP